MTRAVNLASAGSIVSESVGTAPGYMARAWVNFNGTGTVAIRASGNVSSITDNGVGDYTVNFATAMSDANYSVAVGASPNYGIANAFSPYLNTINSSFAEQAPTVSAFRITMRESTASAYDSKYINFSIFR